MVSNPNKWKVDLYNKKHAFVYQYGEELIQFLDPQKKELILDLGCGSGQLTNEISKYGSKVIGIDSSSEMISSAQKKYPYLQFLVKNAASFQFKKPFDANFSNAVLHWVTDFENAIKSMNKNLKANGRLVVEFGGKGNVDSIIEGIKKSLYDRGYIENAKTKIWYFPSISEYTSLLENNGFEVEYAHLIDRPTVLSDNNNGIKDWIDMFGSAFFKDISDENKLNILEDIQNNLRNKHFRDGKWFADYRRIRICARKITS